METTINATEVKKELYISKVSAKFSHYTAGNLYYKIELSDGLYQFPIATVETDYMSPENEGEDEIEVTVLSADLGTTSFENEMKASDLNRWITKAIEKNEFVKIKIL